MLKLIIKTNQWYDNLPGGKRDLFFFVVVLGSLIVAQYFMYARNIHWAFPLWAGILSGWRITYLFANTNK